MKILSRMRSVAINELIDPTVTNNATQHASAFAAAKPFRHVVIDNFFQTNFCSRLVKEFPAFDEKLALNENGEVGAKAVHEQIRSLGSAFAQLDTLVTQKDFRQLIGDIAGIDGLQFDPHYFGGGTHENRHGQDLDPHVDFNYHPRNGQHRRLNLIVYLNPHWEEDWGGLLDLHSDPSQPIGVDQVTRVLPVMNRCVIFETTENSWHGFERINLPEDQRHLSRRSFALYYYSKERPAQQTAKPHSTVYVDRQLPVRYCAGLELTDEHLQELEILLKRRDHHTQRLYRNIQDLSAQLSSSSSYVDYIKKHSQLEAQGDINVNVQRQLQQLAMMRIEVAAMRASGSWRLTRPFRVLKRRLRRWLNGD
ncbi:MAG: 2OG-Fe(II) oxygenase [Lysobacterales bacterium]